jgi:hypothetical protein
MRKLLGILIVVVILIGGTIAYLVATTPRSAPALRFPLTADQEAFVSRVPPSCDSFAFVPMVAVMHARLLANPVTREPLLRWTEQQPLPKAWMLGGADLLVWRVEKSTSYAIRFDRVRATIVRLWTLVAGPHDARWDGTIMLIGDTPAAGGQRVDLALARELPEGHALIVQREQGRGAFPPIGRPALSSVRVTPQEILIVSRAKSDDGEATMPVRADFPKTAILAAAFAQPPRLLGDLNRLLGTDIAGLVSGGGSIALYDVDAGLLLPRPKGVISVPATDVSRAAVAKYQNVIDLVGQTGEHRGELVVSFDRTSLGHYINDERVRGSWLATRWTGRVTPAKLVPLLRRLGDNPGLRFAAPRIYRSVRDLRRWIDALEQAESIEAAESSIEGTSELRVRILSK